MCLSCLPPAAHTLVSALSLCCMLVMQVVGKKLEEAHRRQRLQLPPSMPPELQPLVWDCTHWDPQQR